MLKQVGVLHNTEFENSSKAKCILHEMQGVYSQVAVLKEQEFKQSKVSFA